MAETSNQLWVSSSLPSSNKGKPTNATNLDDVVTSPKKICFRSSKSTVTSIPCRNPTPSHNF